MNSLKQYIDLYSDHRKLFCDGSAEVMNQWRDEAKELLINSVLPRKGSEDFEQFDVDAALAPDYGLNPARVPIEVDPAATFRCEVPNLSTALFMNLNDLPAEADIARRGLPESVIVGSLRKCAEEHPELVATYYNRLAHKGNPISQLDTMLAQDGFFLYVPDGVKVEKPIQLVNILQNGQPLMAVRRMLIVMGKDAEAKVLTCDHTQRSDIDFLTLECTEIFAGEGSHFDLYSLEESTPLTTRLSTLYLHQEAKSNVLIDGITLFNGRTRNEYYCTFAGRGAELHLLGMAIEDSDRQVDNLTMIRHEVPDCRSNELFKYVVDDRARGSFSGRIYVKEGATNTEAYQANRNIVGSKDARMFSKPQLEIYNDDVKCSHGCATGRLDEMQLFYMRTRGLSEQTAKLLLKQAFMSDVIDGVRLQTLQDRLHYLVERRFSGLDSACSACARDCGLK